MEKASEPDAPTPRQNEQELESKLDEIALSEVINYYFSPIERMVIVTSVILCSCPVCAILRGKGVGK